MKRRIIVLAISILIFFSFTSCMGFSHLGYTAGVHETNTFRTNDTIQANHQNQGSVQITSKVYTCPMHPEVLSDKPDKCPKCFMELVVQSSNANSHEHNKMGCMSMMQNSNNKSHIGIYLGGGAMMIGMMTLMVLRLL